jgi:hypothetical protein
MPDLLMILMVLGVTLIVIGLIVYNNTVLDVSINAVSKESMNDYIGYGLIILGALLIFVVGITQAKMVSI